MAQRTFEPSFESESCCLCHCTAEAVSGEGESLDLAQVIIEKLGQREEHRCKVIVGPSCKASVQARHGRTQHAHKRIEPASPPLAPKRIEPASPPLRFRHERDGQDLKVAQPVGEGARTCEFWLVCSLMWCGIVG